MKRSREEEADAPDESELYDRQIRLWGLEAQQRIQGSRVLVYGAGGVGAEVLKNLCLAGISATLVDPDPVEAGDLAANFFLAPSDVGAANRALASLPRVQELNKHVSVSAREASIERLGPGDLESHNVVIVAGGRAPLKEQMRLDEMCRAKGVAFFAADVMGYDGLIFVDLGDAHTYRTESGSGAQAKLSEPKVCGFPSLQEACATGWSQLATKRGGPVSDVYVKRRVAWAFQEASEGGKKLPAPGDEALVKTIAQEMLKANDVASVVTFGDKQAAVVAATSQADLAATCAILAGVLGQEVIKFVSGKG
mmetsp:Transcript_58913/g.133376  ORF Transcript_58913/g.133376 Transcript_58913/m.133376 type:complete len:309 (+) Transcript_58913:27-953(+)